MNFRQMGRRTQPYHQFQDLHNFEQQEIIEDVKPDSGLNMLMNSDKNLINFDQPQSVQRSGNLNTLDNDLSNMNVWGDLRSLRVSQYSEEEIIETFKIFSKLVVIPPHEFFSEFELCIKQMNQKKQQELKDEELLAYQYMEKNIFRILSESLIKYLEKNEPNRLYFGKLEEQIKNGEILKQKSKMIDLLFSDQSLQQKINQFVEKEFKLNVPENVQYIDYFQDIWEDFSYAKQREFNPELPRKAYKTRYHYIYAWDQVYLIIVLLLKSTESKESNILSIINNLNENRNVNGRNYNVSPKIQQMQNVEQAQINTQKPLQQNQKIKNQKDQIMSQQNNSVKQQIDNSWNQFEQHNQLLKQSNNQLRQSNNEQKQFKKGKKQQQLLLDAQQYNEDQQIQFQFDNSIPEVEKINLRLQNFQENQRQDIMISFLSDLIYQDLNSQVKQKSFVSIELLEFHEFMDNNKKISIKYNCGLNNLARLHFHLGRKSNYLIEFMNHNIYKHLFWIDHEIIIIQDVLRKLKQSIQNKSYNLKGKTSYQ